VAQEPGATPVWAYEVTGFQAEKLVWHESQVCVVGKWVVGLPVAAVPLWQVAQEPGVTPVWLKPLAGFHAEVEWQVSQEAVVAIWVEGLLVKAGLDGLWQLAQEPGATPVWAKAVTGFQVEKLVWQASQAWVVGKWVVGLLATG
jgi:hypothetical protein